MLNSITPTTEDEGLISSAITRMREQGAKFAQAYSVLLTDYEVAKTDPALLVEWENLKSKADTVQRTIAWINSQVDSAAGWLGNVFGLEGVRSLQALPLIPLAYVTGAVASLIWVISSIYEFHAKAELVRARLAPGDILGTSGPIGETGNLLKWVIIGAALWYAGPPILKRLGVKL